MTYIDLKSVHDFWNAASCGEDLLLREETALGYQLQLEERYRLEPYISEFAGFSQAAGLSVLEIGVGLGADHEMYARAGARMSGIDLTERAINHVKQRLHYAASSSDLRVADAENLPFGDSTFDLVYSWGVIHHSPNTAKAAREILRVLKPDCMFRVMIYQRRSLVGLMLWLRYAALAGKPWKNLDWVYSNYLESPGTKAYSAIDAKLLFSDASECTVRSILTHGDLLESGAGQRHKGALLTAARHFWPRWLLRRLCRNWGLFLLIEGRK